MIGGCWPWRHPHKKSCTATNVFFDDLRFSCNQLNQVAARRSSRSQNSRPQRAVVRPSCYATAVCRGTAWMIRLPGGLHHRNFGNKMTNDKPTSQKPFGVVPYILSKKKKKSKHYIHKKIGQKKTWRFPPPISLLGFPHQLRRTVAVPLLDLPTRPEAARRLLHLVRPVRCLGVVSGMTSILPSYVRFKA